MSLTYQQFKDGAVDILIRNQREIDRLRGEVAHYKQLAANAQPKPQTYEFGPAPGDPGWRSDGSHDLNEWREHLAAKERQAQESRQRQAFVVNKTQAGAKYDREPMPGDPAWRQS